MKVAMSPETAVLQAELQAAHKAAAKHQSAVGELKQQLSSARAQLQQQRQATATAQVASAGKVFECAKMAAQMNKLRSELQESKHEHQAAVAAARTILTERDEALRAVDAERMQHRATKAALEVSARELQASRAALGIQDAQLRSERKTMKRQQLAASAALAAQQQRLSDVTLRMQHNTEAAARALAAAAASSFTAARTAARCNSLQEEVQQMRMQRDAAAAFAGDLSTQLQQAIAGRQAAEQALAAERRLNSAVAPDLTTACNQDSCSAACPPAAHPAAATSPNVGYPADTDLQESSDGLNPATPPRRTASWGQRPLSVLNLVRGWVNGISSDRRRGSEGGCSSSTGSNSSSRGASSGGS
jgi:chromosome segregation ATPase